jgi:hypothetical protein
VSETKQGLPVAGYQPQTDANIAMVNVNKMLEEHLLRLMDQLQGKDVDWRWLQIGRTHIEQGFMAWNRAIFKPARIAMPDDVQTETPQ